MIIAQISDIHARQGADWLSLLNAAIEHINSVGAEAVLISGDLSNPPHDSGYPQVARALAQLDCPFYAVPGNVDDRDGMRLTFGDTMPFPETGPLTYEVSLGSRLRLLALDVTIPGEIGGRLPEATADWLAERLPASDRPTIIMMHQQPFRMGHEVDHIMCAGSETLEKLLLAGKGNVVAVVCGHGHRTITTQWGGSLALMSPAIRGGEPVSANPPGFVLHDFGSGELVSHVVYLT